MNQGSHRHRGPGGPRRYLAIGLYTGYCVTAFAPLILLIALLSASGVPGHFLLTLAMLALLLTGRQLARRVMRGEADVPSEPERRELALACALATVALSTAVQWSVLATGAGPLATDRSSGSTALLEFVVSVPIQWLVHYGVFRFWLTEFGLRIAFADRSSSKDRARR